MKSKAARLLNAIGGEKQKWLISRNLTQRKIEACEGDSLLGAAMVCYLAPFNKCYRDIYWTKWQKLILKSGIKCTKGFDFSKHFCSGL